LRNLADGHRVSQYVRLDDADITRITKEAESIGIPVSMLKFNTGTMTGYQNLEDLIYVGGDILPDLASSDFRDLMTERAVLAHEYYGHQKFRITHLSPSDWKDEFRASLYAGLNAPGLLPEERRSLIMDAYRRAEEAGAIIRKNRRIKDLLDE